MLVAVVLGRRHGSVAVIFFAQRGRDARGDRINAAHHFDLRQRRSVHLKRDPWNAAERRTMPEDFVDNLTGTADQQGTRRSSLRIETRARHRWTAALLADVGHRLRITGIKGIGRVLCPMITSSSTPPLFSIVLIEPTIVIVTRHQYPVEAKRAVGKLQGQAENRRAVSLSPEFGNDDLPDVTANRARTSLSMWRIVTRPTMRSFLKANKNVDGT